MGVLVSHHLLQSTIVIKQCGHVVGRILYQAPITVVGADGVDRINLVEAAVFQSDDGCLRVDGECLPLHPGPGRQVDFLLQFLIDQITCFDMHLVFWRTGANPIQRHSRFQMQNTQVGIILGTHRMTAALRKDESGQLVCRRLTGFCFVGYSRCLDVHVLIQFLCVVGSNMHGNTHHYRNLTV